MFHDSRNGIFMVGICDIFSFQTDFRCMLDLHYLGSFNAYPQFCVFEQ